MQNTKSNKVNYDNYAKTFAKSRQNMKWPEIDFILNYIIDIKTSLPFLKHPSILWGRPGRDWGMGLTKECINILDIWCGSWRLINYLDEYVGRDNYDYIWLDYSSNMIEEAKNLNKDISNKKKFIVWDMCDFKIEEKQDLIILVASFHHLLDKNTQIKALNNIKKYLKKGWIIAFTNWNLNSDKNLIKYNSREYSLDIDSALEWKWKLSNKWELNNKNIVNIKIWDNLRQYYSFSILELENLFKNSGFNILCNELWEKERNIISIISI